MADYSDSIVASFGGDTSGLRKAMVDAGKMVGDVSKDIEKKFTGTRDVSNALTTALGLNIEKMAEKTARFVTGLSEENEKALRGLIAASDRATDQIIKNMRAQLTDEQRHTLLLQERERLQAKINALSDQMSTALKLEHKYSSDIVAVNQFRSSYDEKHVERTRLTGELAKLEGEIISDNTKKTEKRTREEEKYSQVLADKNRAADEIAMAAMNNAQKIDFLTKNISESERMIADEKTRGRDTSVLEVGLKERQKALASAIADKEKEAAAAREKATDKHIASADKLAKLQFDRLSTDEKIAKLTTQEDQITANIHALKAKGLDTTEAQVALMETQNSLADLRKKKEEATVGVLEEQTEEMARQAQIESSRKGYIGRKGMEYEELSDVQLEEARRNLSKQLFQFRQEDRAADMLSSFTSNLKGPLTAGAELEMAAIEKEMKLRRDFDQVLRSLGERNAERMFDPTTYERLSSRSADQLTQIGQDIALIRRGFNDVFQK